jgi:acetyl-CoA carboxylase carboxyl transferase subunit alpha
MLQNSWYSVISPEGCAAILWKEANERTNNLAANALSLTAAHNLKNGLIDDVIPEPLGGAHRNPKAMAERIQHYVVDWVRELQRIDPDTLVRKRFEKFRSIGSVK